MCCEGETWRERRQSGTLPEEGTGRMATAETAAVLGAVVEVAEEGLAGWAVAAEPGPGL